MVAAKSGSECLFLAYNYGPTGFQNELNRRATLARYDTGYNA